MNSPTHSLTPVIKFEKYLPGKVCDGFVFSDKCCELHCKQVPISLWKDYNEPPEVAFELAWEMFTKIRKEHVAKMSSLDNSQFPDRFMK